MAGRANPGKRFCDWNSLGISAVENRKKIQSQASIKGCFSE